MAVGGNAIRDGERYLVALLFTGPRGGLSELDVGCDFDIRDTGLFFGRRARVRLEALREGDPETAVFRHLGDRAASPQGLNSA